MWQKWALEDGVPEELAGLGRALIREADQHNWSQSLQNECGWSDSGAAMLRLALESPAEARERWEFLLASDGETGRGACHELN